MNHFRTRFRGAASATVSALLLFTRHQQRREPLLTVSRWASGDSAVALIAA